MWKTRTVFAFLSFALMFAAYNSACAQASKTTVNWPSFLGDDRGWAYSPLDQINLGNIEQLRPAWAFSTGTKTLNSTPLVIDGIMYLIAPDQHVYALNATNGKLIWTYKREMPVWQVGATATGAYGLAAGFGLVYLGTLDNHLVAIDAASGHEVWDVEIEDYRLCKCLTSFAPLIVKGNVIVGVRGDNAHRAYLDAYNAKTGKRAWRFWVVPAPGEPGNDSWPKDGWKLGGGATWYIGSYDPALNLVYWGTGNPQPVMNGETRPGANLYTESLVALDADTGKLKWYYQEIPHDTFDFDAMPEPVLIDAKQNGKTMHLVLHANKSGYTYVFDRATGKFLSAWPHADKINWNKGLDKNGQPIEPTVLESDKDTLICPSSYGSRAANHSTYSPRTGWWYNTSYELCADTRIVAPPIARQGDLVEGGVSETKRSLDTQPHIAAFDPLTGKKIWTHPTNLLNASSLLATGGDLIFGGDALRSVWALEAKTGRQAWSFQVGTGIGSAPISYAVRGRQYIAIAAGGAGPTAGLVSKLWPEVKGQVPPGGSNLFVFALPETMDAGSIRPKITGFPRPDTKGE